MYDYAKKLLRGKLVTALAKSYQQHPSCSG